MRLSSVAALIAFALSSSAVLAQTDDHAAHHPDGATQAPAPKAPTPPADMPCPMMDKMKGGMSGGNMQGHSEPEMKAMQEKMKACMAARDKDGEGSGDQHKH